MARLRQLKKGFQVTPYAIKDQSGMRAGKENIAETIAEHLATNTWNHEEAIGKEREISSRKIVTTEEYNTEHPTIQESMRTIKRIKKRKMRTRQNPNGNDKTKYMKNIYTNYTK